MPESNFPISCFACATPTTHKGDAAYLAHMQSAHGGMTPGQAMNQQKAIDQNIPKEIPLVKDAPPSKEFMEVAQMMDKPQQEVQTQYIKTQSQQLSPPASDNFPAEISKSSQEEIKPITLKYKYEGNCKICNAPVRTIMAKANGKTIAIAYCLTHEQIEEQEVYPLDRDMTPDEINNMYKNMDIGVVQNEMMDNMGIHNTIHAEARTNGFVDQFAEIAKRDIRLHKEYIDKEKIEKLLMERRKKASMRYKKPKNKIAEVVDKDE